MIDPALGCIGASLPRRSLPFGCCTCVRPSASARAPPDGRAGSLPSPGEVHAGRTDGRTEREKIQKRLKLNWIVVDDRERVIRGGAANRRHYRRENKCTMGPSLCKVNCCNIRPQRALYVLILPEFCHCLPEFLLVRATFIILQPSGGKLPYGAKQETGRAGNRGVRISDLQCTQNCVYTVSH